MELRDSQERRIPREVGENAERSLVLALRFAWRARDEDQPPEGVRIGLVNAQRRSRAGEVVHQHQRLAIALSGVAQLALHAQ